MSDNFNSMLHELPVEILRQILDKLDAHTILCSFRYTCRKFRAIVKDYNRYILNFQSISKPNFDQICHLIDPNHVTTLILSESNQTYDQIKLFLNYFRLQQFNGLYSLSLFIRDEEAIRSLAGQFNIPSLEIFSFKIDRFDDRRKTTTARILSKIIAKSNLWKLQLHMQDGRFEKIIWPNPCSIRYLEVNNTIAIEQLHSVLRCSPHLQTVVINSFFILNPNQPISMSFDQLTSLTMNKLNMKINDLEFCLSRTRALTYLKLIGAGEFCDGYRWENFIQLNLRSLNKFEFYFTEIHFTQKSFQEVKLIAMKFQTPFWLEQKKWFIMCELDADTSKCITLSSIPICIPVFSYERRLASISTYPEFNDEPISIMDNVNTLKLDFNKLVPFDTKRRVCITSTAILCNSAFSLIFLEQKNSISKR